MKLGAELALAPARELDNLGNVGKSTSSGQLRSAEGNATPRVLLDRAFKLLALLEQQDSRIAGGIGVALMVLLGFVDYATGFEISFAVFYLLPVALVAWVAGRSAGFGASLACAAEWHLSNHFAGELYSHPAIPYWNMLTRLGFFLTTASLLTALRDRLEAHQELALTDYLTGARNRRAFYDDVRTEMYRFRRYGRPFTVVYMDADNFKEVNDRLGHQTGDDLLRAVASTLRHNLRDTDVVARLGGDEFAVLLPETGYEQAEAVVAKLQAKLLTAMGRQGWPVTFSVGALTCATALGSVDEMVSLADGLMYEAKRAGKNVAVHAQHAAEPVAA